MFLCTDGKLSTQTNAVRIEQEDGIVVFNFKVEGNHNYFILAKEYEYGQTCVLVHNGKCFQLPSAKKVTVDKSHILSGHVANGSRVSPNSKKDLFPSDWSISKIINSIMSAYKNARIIEKQGERMFLRGKAKDGTVIEMWFNKARHVIESAWPKF